MENDYICSYCGTKRKNKKVKDEKEKVFCPTCGDEMMIGDEFDDYY